MFEVNYNLIWLHFVCYNGAQLATMLDWYHIWWEENELWEHRWLIIYPLHINASTNKQWMCWFINNIHKFFCISITCPLLSTVHAFVILRDGSLFFFFFHPKYSLSKLWDALKQNSLHYLFPRWDETKKRVLHTSLWRWVQLDNFFIRTIL